MKSLDELVAEAHWRKSTYSGGGGNGGGNCVECATLRDGRIAVRDSKDPHGPVLTFSPAAFRAWIDDVATWDVDR